MQAPRAPLNGRYRYQQSLKVGSKAVVWLADDEQTGKTVVAAALPGSRAAGLKGLVDAEIPHLATIRDVVIKPDPSMIPSESGSPVRAAAVAVADHVPGRTLHERLKKGKVTPHEVARWFALLARAVDAMHAHQGIHGAISARSIVTYPASGIAAPVLTHLVAPASGAYCAPERLQGGPPTAEGDVWALHATLYTAFTRTTPFSGQTKEKLVIAMLGGDITPLADSGIHDPELQTIINRGLAPDDVERCSNARELARALEDWLGERDSEPDAGPMPPSVGPPSSVVPSIPPSLDWDENAETIVSSEPPPEALAQMARDAQAERPSRRPPPTPPPRPPAISGADDLPEATEEDDATVMTTGLPFDLDSLPPGAPEPEPAPPGLATPAAEEPAVEEPPAAAGRAPGAQLYDADEDDDAATRMMDRPLLMEDPLPQFGLPSDDDEPALSAEAPPLGGLPMPSDQASSDDDRMSAPPISRVLPEAEPTGDELEDAVSSSDPGRELPPLGAVPIEEQPRKSKTGLIAVLLLLLVGIAVAIVVLKRRELGLGQNAGDQPTAAPVAAANTAPPSTTLEPTLDAGAADATGSAAAAAPGAEAGSPAADAVGDESEVVGPYKAPSTPDERVACVKGHFEPGTFRSAQSFEFLCEKKDLRGVNAQLHRSLVRSGSGYVTPGMKEWSTFGWYELAATAVLRANCCPGVAAVDLPDLGKVCPSLDEVLTKHFGKMPPPEQVSEYSKPFEKAVLCLYNSNIRRPYRYGPRPMLANRFAFERFLMRAAQFVHDAE